MKVLRRFGRVIVFICVVIIVSTFVSMAIQNVFSVRDIEIQGSDVTVQIDETKLYKNLLFFPAAKMRMQLLQENPLLKDVQIYKKFPHTLVIVAIKRTAAARLLLPDRTVLIDREGIVIGYQTPHDMSLPEMRFDISPVQPGQRVVSGNVLQALAFIAGARELSVDEITLLDSQSLRAKVDRTDIYFPQNGDIGEKLTTLQTLTSGFRIKGILPKVIDLRFNKPIVTF